MNKDNGVAAKEEQETEQRKICANRYVIIKEYTKSQTKVIPEFVDQCTDRRIHCSV